MKSAGFILALVTVALVTGCARLRRGEVIGIAIRAAEREGIRLSEYKKPTARYRISPDGRTWVVSFVGEAPIPDNHFFVQIDDRTGEAKLRGRK
jgi:hypothetical protein